MLVVFELVNLLIERHAERPVQRIADKCRLPTQRRLACPAGLGKSRAGQQAPEKDVEMWRCGQVRLADIPERYRRAFSQQRANPKRSARAQCRGACGMEMVGHRAPAESEIRSLKRAGNVAGIPTGIHGGIGHWEFLWEHGFGVFQFALVTGGFKQPVRLLNPAITGLVAGVLCVARIEITAAEQAVLFGGDGVVNHPTDGGRIGAVKSRNEEH